MTYYFKSGNTVNLQASDSMDVLDHLPADTYVVKKNEITNTMYLQTMNQFDLPYKIYGNYSDRAEKIINTFNDRNSSTGLLLTGDKGSGKTLLSKIIATKLIQNNIPIIVVNEPLCGPIFNELVGKINQPAMILFDEFDKIYDKDEQKELLTLLDGTIQTKKLFVFTANYGTIDEHMINRPGRIYYKFDYKGIGEDFVRDYCEDRLNNKSRIDGVTLISNSFTSFTFDMLQSLIEEMNRYDEEASSAIRSLNIDLNKETVNYDVTILVDGKPITNTFWPRTVNGNPLINTADRSIEIYTSDSKKNQTFDDDSNLPELRMSKETFFKISKGGVLTFRFKHNESDIFVILEKKQEFQFNWDLL